MERISKARDVAGFKEWLEETGRSTNTARVYETMLGLGERGLRNSELAPKTRYTIRAALRAWAEYTKDEVLLARVQRIHLPMAKAQRANPPFDTKDWKRLRDAIRALPPIPVALVCGVMVDRGLRVGDVLRLTRKDIEEAVATGVLAFTAKQGKRLQYRAKRILPYLEKFLAYHLRPKGGWHRVEDLVSPKAVDKRVAGRQRVSRLLKSLALRLGLDPKYVHPHRLRRTYAVEFLKALGPDPRALAKIIAHMQWESIETAMVYVGYVSNEELAEIEDSLE